MTDEPARVTTLELFFDLVFVLTITQLTSLLAGSLRWRTVWHAVVMLGLIFWMYDGYAWLTNAVPARGGARTRLLLGGMSCYLVLALATPDAFRGTGLTFGLAYLAIIAIHSFLYITAAGESSSLAMRALAPWNLAGAAVVLVCGALGGTAQELGWTGVFLMFWFATRVGGGFEIEPSHFVERHGLLVIVAIGESVVAAGAGARHQHVIDLPLVAVAVLGLLLSAGFWWTYFGGDEQAVERAFTAATGPARPRIAFEGFGYAHFVMLFGVLLTAVGVRFAVSAPGDTLAAAQAFALGAGTVLFLLGYLWFEVILGLRRRRARDALTLALLAAVPVATAVSAAAGLAVTVAGYAALLALADVSRSAPPTRVTAAIPRLRRERGRR